MLEDELYPTGDGLNFLEIVFFEKKICLKDNTRKFCLNNLEKIVT